MGLRFVDVLRPPQGDFCNKIGLAELVKVKKPPENNLTQTCHETA